MNSTSQNSKSDINKPDFTLDIKLVVFRHPSTWLTSMDGLAQLEYNYFELNNIEICMTPRAVVKIINKQPIHSLGFEVYKKIHKCKFYKDKPDQNTLTLNRYESNELWLKIRNLLWSEVDDDNLSYNLKLNITQLFFHSIISGCSNRSIFLTIDNHFHQHNSMLYSKLNICVMNPQQAWSKYQPINNLYIPDENDINWMWQHQHYHLGNLLYVLDDGNHKSSNA